jgi:hypothetical protein
MRVVLALGLLLALCASADAARAHHAGSRHVIIRQGYAFPRGSAVREWSYAPLGSSLYRSYAAPRPDPYGDTPSYDDPSKFGG